MRIAGAALNQIPFDWAHNLRNIRTAIEQAKSEGVELLCLPELCLTGYGCEDLFLSDWLPAAALAHLQQIRPLDGRAFAWWWGCRCGWTHRTYNTAAVLRDGQILGFAAKQFLANDGVHYETRFFAPWLAGETTTVNFGGRKLAAGRPDV
ncbi:MAG: nitrilase-related carbon-nitrogen hydrolase [Hymenobacter sp.]